MLSYRTRMPARVAGGLCLLFLCLFASQVTAQVPAVTRWMHPDGLPKPDHNPSPTWGPLLMRSLTPRDRGQTITHGGQGRLCVVVDSDVYSSISNKLLQFEADLSSDGYNVDSYLYEGGSAEDLRAYFSNLYSQAESLVGAILVGQIPYVVYELTQNWGSGDEYENFPCDVFYMDVDGVWEDNTNAGSFGDGRYDSHSGNTDLEIWVSRIKTDRVTLLGSETALINNYFDKNRGFRAGDIRPHRRGLAYVDDDWIWDTTEDSRNQSWTYSDLHVAARLDQETTSADDYINNHMTSNYEIVHVRAHGSATSHGFYTNNRSSFTSVNSADYRRDTPRALFYSLFVCSGCDFTIYNNLGSTIAFNTNDAGLLAWGSTKTGGMWNDDRFYERAADGYSIGESFRQWFNYVCDWYPSMAKPWWYGMVVLGDGSLCFSSRKPHLGTFGREGNQLSCRWGVIQDMEYCFERANGLVGAIWSNVVNVITAADFNITCNDTNPPFGFWIYRLCENPAKRSNLLQNASFELPGTTASALARHWEWNCPDTHGSTWGAASRERWRAKSGECLAAIKGSWSGQDWGGWWQDAAVSPGTTYKASAWFWADQTPPYGPWTAAVQELKIEFYPSDLAGPLLTVTQDLTGVNETWTKFKVTGEAPPTAAWARFVVGVSGAGAAGALQIDDARLVPVP